MVDVVLHCVDILSSDFRKLLGSLHFQLVEGPLSNIKNDIVCIAEDFERVEYPDSCHFDPHFAELVFHECFGFVQIDFSIDHLMDLEHF